MVGQRFFSTKPYKRQDRCLRGKNCTSLSRHCKRLLDQALRRIGQGRIQYRAGDKELQIGVAFGITARPN